MKAVLGGSAELDKDTVLVLLGGRGGWDGWDGWEHGGGTDRESGAG